MATELERLIERLLAGNLIAPESIAPELLEQPEVQRLLRLSRVMAQLDANAATRDSDSKEASAASEIAPTRLGPFKLERRLGVGGMGEVWLGLRDDGQAEQRVAVKRVRGDAPNFAERLRSERRILARLEHAQIARFIDAGVDAGGAPWLALEYVDGLPITDYCAREGLSLQARLRLFQKVCAAVDHAHGQLVVHRDLKPGNVLVGADGEPKLLDFGIARLLDDSQAEATSSALTPAYAAPEQLRGEPVSTATDVYALGLLLFRLLAGQLPPGRRRGSLVQALEEIGRESQQRPSEQFQPEQPFAAAALRGDLDAIVGQALRAEPAQRYRSARELGEDIERHLQSRPVRARPPTRRYRLSRFVRRNAAAVGFAALAALALLAGTAIALEQARRATAAALRAEAEADAARQAQARAERVQRLLVGLFTGASPELNGGRMPSARDLLVEGGRELARAELEPADAAELAATLAESWLALGETEHAATLLAAAPQDAHIDPRTRARLALAGARIEQAAGHLDVARERFEQAGIAATQAGEPAALEASSALMGLAHLDLFSGDYARSLERSQIAHAERLRRYGAGDRASLDSGVALAVAHIANNQLDAAIAQFQRSLADAQARLGAINPVACRAGSSLSDAYERRGDYAQALSAGEQAAEACRQVFGPAHPLYGQVELNVGFALGRLGRNAEAIEHYALARSAYSASKHFDEGSALRYAAGALLALERWQEAEATLLDAERVLAAALGEDAELVLAARINRASALAGQGRLDAATELAEASLAAVEAGFPTGNSTLRNGLRVLGVIRRDQGRIGEALALHQRLLTAEQEVSGEHSPPVAVARQQLARDHLARGNAADLAAAEALLDAAVAVLGQPERSAQQRLQLQLDRAGLRQAQGQRKALREELAQARELLAQIPEPPPSAAARLRALEAAQR